MELDDEIPSIFYFLPLNWLLGGYCLSRLTKPTSDYLERRKAEHMSNLCYHCDGNGGYDEGLDRTVRLIKDDGGRGKYLGGIRSEMLLLMVPLMVDCLHH